MTEDEHIELVAAGDRFCLRLAEITGDTLNEFRPEIHDEVMMYLQDHTSLYSPYTGDAIQKYLETGCVS